MSLYEEIEKSFPKIKGFITRETLREFSEASPDKLEGYNFGLGTMIRLKLLHPRKTLYGRLLREGYVNQDEMAMRIISEFHGYLRRQPLEEFQSGEADASGLCR